MRHKAISLTVVGLVLALAFSAQAPAQAPLPVQKEPEQATAPADIIASTVLDIPKGAKAMVTPEAVIIDEAKKVWLHKHQPVGGDTGVTVLHMNDGTYEVEISDAKLRWLKVPVSDEMKKQLMPVKKIHLPKK